MSVKILLSILLISCCLCITYPVNTEARPQSIKVVMDNNYPPYVFPDNAGKLQGILIDQWRLWEQKSGIKAEIHAMDWDKALAGMKAGEFDVIDTVFKTEERSEWLDFSHPYAKVEVPIFFKTEISGITDAASLDGFTVGAKSGDAAVDLLKRNGVKNLVFFNSYEAIILAAKEHKINVFVADKPPALYYLHKYGIIDQFRQSAPLGVGEFHRAVKKGNSQLLKTIEEGFSRITPDEFQKIELTWHGTSLKDSRSLRYFLIGIGALGLLVLVLFISNRILHKAVNIRTAELKSSSETLHGSEAFINDLMNAIPVPIFYKDKHGRYLGFNTSYEKFYGLTKAELIGKSVFDIAPKELADVYHAKDLELFQHSGTQIYESKVKNAQGVVRDVIFHKAAFKDGAGNVSGLIGAIMDITDRMEKERALLENEQKFTAFFEQGYYFAGLMNTDGILTDVNSTALTFSGAEKQDVLGKPFWDTPWWAHSTELQEKLRRAVASAAAGTLVTFEASHPTTDGSIHYVDFSLRPVKDQSGKVIFLVPEGCDITEHKKAAEERLNLERQLLHSQKLESLGILSGGIAHDFNNLLQAVLGNLDLALMRLPADADVRRQINQAINAGKHAAKLTNMMLAYSGKGLIDIKPLDLSGLVEENAAMLEAAITKSVTLELNLDRTLPATMADAGQLQQVVMNLITNASEAIGVYGGKIKLSTGISGFDQDAMNSSRLEEKQAAGHYVWMKVSDNGCGMNGDVLQKLFDPFFTTKFTGRGLGMSAVLGIMRAHKGAFLVESSPGVGTTIQVLFPVADRSHKKPGDVLVPAALTTTDNCHNSVILVVDDEKMIREVSSAMLEELGFIVLSADSGEEALRIFKEQEDRIDLVLLDQVMPGMDGVSVFNELRRIRPEIKVLLASGYSEQEVAERFMGLGLNGFIPKPYNIKLLDEELQRAFERSDSATEN